MLSGQELPSQRAHDNEGVNSVYKALDANGDPSKDSDHTINAENTNGVILSLLYIGYLQSYTFFCQKKAR
jgi:hypothetical protein